MNPWDIPNFKWHEGYGISLEAQALVFTKPGKVKLQTVKNPFEALKRNSSISGPANGRWVAYLPLVVAFCPTDYAGGNLDANTGELIFPPRWSIPFARLFDDLKNPAIAGHESVGILVGANKKTLEELRTRNIHLGALVTGDINTGCGDCINCDNGDEPMHCVNGTTFLGITGSQQWTLNQTGMRNLPGAYQNGLMLIAKQNLHRVPDSKKIKTLQDLILYSQADAIACAQSSMNAIGIGRYEGQREILIIGAGRLGSWHAYLLEHHLGQDNAKIFLADINPQNLNLVGNTFGIPEGRRYCVEGRPKDYDPKKLEKALGTNRFHLIIDCSNHGAITPRVINGLMTNCLYRGGAFCTTAHTGIEGIAGFTDNNAYNRLRFCSGLTPGNNIPFALERIREDGTRFTPLMREIEGGVDNPKLPDYIANGGGPLKKDLDRVTYFSVVQSPETIRQYVPTIKI